MGLWNIIKDKDNVNTHVKSQDNNANKRANKLITFYKNKKVSRNISYFFLHKKKSIPTSKSNISAKSKKSEFDKLQGNIQNVAARGYIDSIIEPIDTRKYLIGAFEMLYTKEI